MKKFFINLIKNRWNDTLLIIDNKNILYKDLYINGYLLAQEWEKLGLKEKDHILIKLDNSVELLTSYFATIIGNFVAIPIVSELTDDIIEYIQQITNYHHTYEFPLEFQYNLNIINKGQINIKKNDDDEFVIFFTSGTTSDPKPIVHSFSNIIGSAYSFSKLTTYEKTTIVYHILPIAYMAGFLNTFFAPLLGGSKIVLGKKFKSADILTFWDAIFKYDINRLSITPSIAQMLLTFTRDKEIIRNIPQQIQQIQCTSSSIPLTLRKNFFNKFKIPLQDCYGITELGGALTFQSYDDARKFNDYTTPHSQLEYKVINSTLYIKSPYSMIGYLINNSFDNPMDKDGFINTGDLAVIEDKKIKIIGREKDIIIKGGINISPSRIEHIITLHLECEITVIGIPHDYWGEIIVACVVSDIDITKEIINISNTYLSDFEQIDKVINVPTIPKSFIGKIQKQKLKQKVINEFQSKV